MKIKVRDKEYKDVLLLRNTKHEQPCRQSFLIRTLLKLVSLPELKATHFEHREIGMEQLGRKEPCLILMNHSSFIDLKIAASILYPRPFHIVCTSDGFVGKEWIMRKLGCIPTNKFVFDTALVRDMLYCVKDLNSSVLMYPEASYSFDGTPTPLPESIGKLIKLLGVPVVMIKTYGAFLRDPLYNRLRLRKVNVSADVRYLLSQEEIKKKTPEELNQIVKEQFTFDNFKWQQTNGIQVSEDFRADGLNRVLYKCPSCLQEGSMQGSGTNLTCISCGKEYHLTESGYIKASRGSTEFPHIPDWYSWQRDCVKQEIIHNKYHLDVEVDILVLVDTKCVYRVGEGRLVHNVDGFELTGCDGNLKFTQKTTASYSLYSDYYWYEIGDVICIGDTKIRFYCFPKEAKDIVAKTRLATEELYKLAIMELRNHKRIQQG